MPKNIEKWCQKCAKMMPKWTQHQLKNRLFRERWFCKKPLVSLGKTYFLRFRGSKNLWKVDQKTMRKRASKKWCKIDQKWSQNGAKMNPKMVKNGAKISSKIHRKIRLKNGGFQEVRGGSSLRTALRAEAPGGGYRGGFCNSVIVILVLLGYWLLGYSYRLLVTGIQGSPSTRPDPTRGSADLVPE